MAQNTLQSAYIDLIANGDFTHALTLKPNAMGGQAAGPVSRISSSGDRYTLCAPRVSLAQKASAQREISYTNDALFSRLERFAMLFDRRLVGRRFNEPKNRHLRTKFVAVAEGNTTNGHLHCAIKVHPERSAKFSAMCSADEGGSIANVCWIKVSQGGTLVVKEIDDPRGWGAYMVKSLFGEHRSDRVRFIN